MPTLSRHNTNAPNANSAATSASTARCGSSLSKPPAVTATTHCTPNAQATPSSTGRGRYLVDNTRVATSVLSGSSTSKMAPNAMAKVTMKDNIELYPAGDEYRADHCRRDLRRCRLHHGH